MTFKYINDKLLPVFVDYAESEAKKIATLVINQAINKEVSNELSVDDLFVTTKDENGNIKNVDFNPMSVNKMLSMVTNNVQEYLTKLELGEIEELGLSKSKYFSNKKDLKNGVIFEIPSGVIYNNIILTNIGPKIPVKLNMVGDISSNINTNVTEYGINNALVQIYIKVEVIEQVILPYVSKRIKVETDIPVAIKLVQGEIPTYYFNGLTSSNLTVPTK